GVGAAFLGLAWLAQKAALDATLPWRTGVAVTAVAAFMVVLFSGPITNSRVRRGNDTGAAIVRLKNELPADVKLVSLGHTYSELPFFTRQPVKPLPWPAPMPIAIPEGGYFCFNATSLTRPELPFGWREVKAISMDRNLRPIPEDVLV